MYRTHYLNSIFRQSFQSIALHSRQIKHFVESPKISPIIQLLTMDIFSYIDL